MITLEDFIEHSTTAWNVARAQVMCWDDLNNLRKFDINSIEVNHRWYVQMDIESMGINISDVAHTVSIFVSDQSVRALGYSDINLYIRANRSIICAKFSQCSDRFANITEKLGRVNGCAYTNRTKRGNEIVFFF